MTTHGYVPVQAVFGKGGKYFVFVDASGEAAPLEVKIGLSSTDFVEVKEGLAEGQNVRLAVTDEMKVKLPQDQAQTDLAEARPRRWPTTQPAIEAISASRPATEPAPVPASRPRP